MLALLRVPSSPQTEGAAAYGLVVLAFQERRGAWCLAHGAGLRLPVQLSIVAIIVAISPTMDPSTLGWPALSQ